jgi:hypothetical protein
MSICLRHAVHIRITSARATADGTAVGRRRSDRLLDAFAVTRGARQGRLSRRWAGPLAGLPPLACRHWRDYTQSGVWRAVRAFVPAMWALRAPLA